MSDPVQIPPALVLGCNTPHGVGVLSDWIEEQTGFPPDFYQSGWSENSDCQDDSGNGDGYSNGNGNGDGYGNGQGCGWFYGYGWGDGNGQGCGWFYGYGWGDGIGDGWRFHFI